MDVIESFTQEDANWTGILNSNSLELILANLSKSVALKYQWQRQGRNPPLWQKAAITSRSILQRAIPKMFELDLEAKDQERHWKIPGQHGYLPRMAEKCVCQQRYTIMHDSLFELNSVLAWMK